MFLMDGEFECLREALLLLTPPVDLKVTSELEHIPEIERSIRVTKEGVRAERTILLFRSMPLIIKKLVSFQILWLNAFPVKFGVSTMISPQTIMTQSIIGFKI